MVLHRKATGAQKHSPTPGARGLYLPVGSDMGFWDLFSADHIFQQVAVGGRLSLGPLPSRAKEDLARKPS